MGIFSRIGDVLKANINDMIDRAEDPEKMVKQIILDLQKEVSKATQALGKAMASERIAKRQYEDAVKTSTPAKSIWRRKPFPIRSRQTKTSSSISRCMSRSRRRPHSSESRSRR